MTSNDRFCLSPFARGTLHTLAHELRNGRLSSPRDRQWNRGTDGARALWDAPMWKGTVAVQMARWSWVPEYPAIDTLALFGSAELPSLFQLSYDRVGAVCPGAETLGIVRMRGPVVLEVPFVNPDAAPVSTRLRSWRIRSISVDGPCEA